MCFDKADDHIHAFGPALGRRIKHGVGLAHTRRHAQEDFQFAALLARFIFLNGLQQRDRGPVEARS